MSDTPAVVHDNNKSIRDAAMYHCNLQLKDCCTVMFDAVVL